MNPRLWQGVAACVGVAVANQAPYPVRIVPETPDFPEVAEGEVLAGRYRVERVIARGGMGVVVAAKHIQLGQRVAIKVLHHQSGDAAQSVARFLTEAKASALLRSEHVVKVSDVGMLDGGAPFMVMEFLDGADLASVLDQEGPLPAPIAVDFVLQALEGLAAAHAARLVHRDLKPGNIFRTSRDDGSTIIKVLDFGVSKASSADMRAEGTVTTTDAVFGSPLYMSPEQMQSATRVDERSDIWSLGIVLFELLTGRLPFEAESMAGLAVAIATQQPATLSAYLTNTPPGLDDVIAKCLAKRPDGRYANVAELASDLEPFVPDARSRVERIQRLLLGKTNPSRPIPSAISSRKVLLGAETLGPVDAGTDAFATQPPKKSRAWMIAAVGLMVTASVGGAVILRVRRDPPLKAAAMAPSPTVNPPSTAEASTANTVVVASNIAPPKPDAPSTSSAIVSVTHPTVVRPISRPTHPSSVPSASAAPSVVSSGIARDRK